MTLIRLVFIAALVLAAAVFVPKFAPSFIAGMSETAATSSRDSAPPQRRQELAGRIVLDADARGHFLTQARIDGRSVDVMVDTGASVVAINAETARRLGALPPKSAFRSSIRTANGIVAVAPITLSEIRLGNVVVHKVDAVVVPGDALAINLLGMSFLGRLSGFEIAGGELVLTQ